jgi:glutaredoxin 3
MSPIEIYTSPFCPYCSAAMDLLRHKGANFSEIDISAAPERRQEMIERASGRTTVPQIFIGKTHVGGCDDLYALDAAGELDPLLAS